MGYDSLLITSGNSQEKRCSEAFVHLRRRWIALSLAGNTGQIGVINRKARDQLYNFKHKGLWRTDQEHSGQTGRVQGLQVEQFNRHLNEKWKKKRNHKQVVTMMMMMMDEIVTIWHVSSERRSVGMLPASRSHTGVLQSKMTRYQNKHFSQPPLTLFC